MTEEYGVATGMYRDRGTSSASLLTVPVKVNGGKPRDTATSACSHHCLLCQTLLPRPMKLFTQGIVTIAELVVCVPMLEKAPRDLDIAACPA